MRSVWLILLAPTGECAPPERLTQRFGEVDGLPVDDLFTLSQADDGAIWIGSALGPVRYDSWRFQLEQGAPATEQTVEPVIRGESRWGPVDGELVRFGPAGEQETVPTAIGRVRSALVDAEGSLWVAGSRGLVRFPEPETRHWPAGEEPDEPVPCGWIEAPALPCRTPLPDDGSVRGGRWTFGVGRLVRVAGDRDVEALGAAQGLSIRSPSDVAELPDGTVWVRGRGSLGRVPSTARQMALPTPHLTLVKANTDNVKVDGTAPIVLRWDRNRLKLKVVAPTYRDPAALRYRLRIDDREQIQTGGNFRFHELAPGDYHLTIEASLDGSSWSNPIEVDVTALRAPWLRWWAILGYLVLAGVLLWAIHRARVEHLLRLERQRARIALDLHDEVGSGLGSIGLVAGALPMLEDPAAAAQTIADTSAEIGQALTDIVWALKAESERPEVIVDFLRARGNALFADPGVTFALSTAAPPTGTLSLPARRCMTAVALEAMHNAAKYANATEVRVEVEPGRTWTVRVIDDGGGMDPNAALRPGGGTGLAGMKKRAATIGAELTIDSTPRGTTVTLTFDPGANDVRTR